MQKILITGATGSIGQKLASTLVSKGNEVYVFTQNPQRAREKLPTVNKIIKWDYENIDSWSNELNGKDVVIHLAGANLAAKRWNKKYKKLAYDSRIISTKNLVEAIKSAELKPKAFICSSAVGYYGDRGDDILGEGEPPANNYLANLCADWEKEAENAEDLGVRRVSVRTGLVLNKNEGLLKQLLPSFKFFMGGYLGSGKQWFPWIHIDDIVGIYLHAIENEKIKGAVNGASIGIVTNKEFSKTLGKVLGRPALFPIPKFALKIVSGELGEYVSDSQRVSVDKILNSGYKFKFENLEEALRDLL